MIAAAVILQALEGEPVFYGDRDMPVAERRALLAPLAGAIAGAAHSEWEAAMLEELASAETRLASLVLRGRCSEMPKSMRCDNGRARGVFSLHREACREAWTFAPGDPASLPIEAECAIRLLRFNAHRGRQHAITPTHAAFCGYGARAWSCSLGEERTRGARAVLVRIRKLEAEASAAGEVAEVRP